jgi:hypothetical protein
MSLTSYALGASAVAGFKTHTNDWNTTNTGVDLGANDALEILMQGAPRSAVGMSENLSATGGVGIRKYPVKATENSGPQRLWALLYGTEAVAANGSGYDHTMTWATNSTGTGNLAWTDNLVCHDIPMLKVNGLTFESAEGQIATLTANVVGKQELIDGSGLNTLANMTDGTVTLPTQAAIRYLQTNDAQCVVRIADASAAALGAGNVVNPSLVRIAMNRQMQNRFTTLNTPYIDEPLAGNWLEPAITLEFPLWDTTQDWTDIVAATEKKMDIIYTGTTIGGGANWEYKWEFPSVFISSDGLPELSNEDLLTLTMNCMAHTAATAPTGMAFTLPRLTITDTTSATHFTSGA